MVKKSEIFSIPNVLSCIRILLIPVFVTVFLEGIKTDGRSFFIWAAAIVALSGFTDVADGFIARKFNMITEFGKLLDPLADKLTQAAIVFCLILKYPMVWTVIVIFVIKEIFMAVSGIIFFKKGKKLDGAKWFGKLSTVVFYVLMFTLIGAPTLDDVVVIIFMLVTSFFLILSFALYAREYFRMYKQMKSDEKAANDNDKS